MNSIKELNSPQPQLTLVLALLLVRDTPPGMSVIGTYYLKTGDERKPLSLC